MTFFAEEGFQAENAEILLLFSMMRKGRCVGSGTDGFPRESRLYCLSARLFSHKKTGTGALR